MDEIKDFLVGEHAEDGMGVVEVLLIIVEQKKEKPMSQKMFKAI